MRATRTALEFYETSVTPNRARLSSILFCNWATGENMRQEAGSDTVLASVLKGMSVKGRPFQTQNSVSYISVYSQLMGNELFWVAHAVVSVIIM